MDTPEDLPSAATAFAYDAFISYAVADRPWAEALVGAIAGRGLRCAADFNVTEPSKPWGEALNEALVTSRTLIVLCSAATSQIQGVERELAIFRAIAQQQTSERRILPVFLGDNAISAAPTDLASIQGVVISSEVYATGPENLGIEGVRAVQTICDVLTEDVPPATKTSRGGGSWRALQHLRASISVEGEQVSAWLIDSAFVIASVEPGDWSWAKFIVSTPFGSTEGTAIPWDFPHREEVSGLTAIRLEPPINTGRPLPIGVPTIGRNVEVWGASHAGPEAWAKISDQVSNNTAMLKPEDGVLHVGSIAWDAVLGAAVGIVCRGEHLAWRMIPLAHLESLTPGRRADAAEPSAPFRLEDPEPTLEEIAPTLSAPPSARVHDDGWTVDDELDHALYARALTEFIRHPDTRPPLVIGIQGPWGQGKTSLMRMIQQRLDPGHPDLRKKRDGIPDLRQEGPSELTYEDLRSTLDGDLDLDRDEVQPAEARSVWFNAWKYQSSESLWAGLAHSILSQLPARLSARERELFWLKLQLRRVDGAAVRRDIQRAAVEWLIPRLIGTLAVALVVAAALVVFGADALVGLLGGSATGALLACLSWARARSQSLGRRLEGSYLRYVSQPDYDGKVGYLHHVEEDMRRALDLLTPADQPTVIFIDDLDRCSPGKIGEVLEAINLFLSGEYPNCVFVLGIDDEVVAAAMEIVHDDVIKRLGNRKSEMGWRFMDKFIQLSFSMPRLTERQKSAYLMSLLGRGTPDAASNAVERATVDAERIRSELRAGVLEPRQAARRVGELAPDLVAADSTDWREVAEDVISLGARDFSDADVVSAGAMRAQMPHLSDNPRTIKRAVNLFRFHQFTAWARDASPLGLQTADPDLIARWIVIAVRWPQVVRWLQVNGGFGQEPAKTLEEAWGDPVDPALAAYLARADGPDIARAGECGLW
jgi:KAP family P-loop domain/TIR domain